MGGALLAYFMVNTIQLYKKYIVSKDNKPEVLKDINLSIKKGEFVGIVGKSGSGKTTLLNLIGGLDKATYGIIEVDGIEITKLSDDELCSFRNKTIGFIFQSYYLDPHLTVLQNIALPLMIAGVSKKEREIQAQEYLSYVGLSDKAKSKPTQLSGGEAQRVAIARSIITRPKLLLADEPTGNLDTLNGKAIMALLEKIHNDGATVILVTHNMNDIKSCTRVIELEDGMLKSDTASLNSEINTANVENNNMPSHANTAKANKNNVANAICEEMGETIKGDNTDETN